MKQQQKSKKPGAQTPSKRPSRARYQAESRAQERSVKNLMRCNNLTREQALEVLAGKPTPSSKRPKRTRIQRQEGTEPVGERAADHAAYLHLLHGTTKVKSLADLPLLDGLEQVVQEADEREAGKYHDWRLSMDEDIARGAPLSPDAPEQLDGVPEAWTADCAQSREAFGRPTRADDEALAHERMLDIALAQEL